METNANSRISRANAAVPVRRTASGAKVRPKNVDAAQFSSLLEDLQDAPEVRPGWVKRAKSLIADPGFPDSETEQAVAEQMAIHLSGGHTAFAY